MTTLILRQGIGGKGSPLTMTELDSNFINLNADKVEVADAVSTNSVNKVVRRDAAGNFSAGTITADLDGNATSADKLSTARTISLSGDATGFATFDGSSNAIIDVTLTSNSVELGVGTTGNYVASVSTTAPLVGGSLGSESAALTIALNSGYGDIQNPYEAKTAKTFLAAPNAATGLPTFRAILASDIPTLNQNTTGTASNVTGTVAVENGGTGSTTPSGARTNLGLGNLATLNAVGNAQINDGVVTFAKFAQSEWSSAKQTFGYQKLPSGLIMQWGYVITGTNGQATWTFPVAFPNRVLKIVTGCANAVFAIVNTDPSTTTTQQVYTTDANSTPVSNIAVALLAIGH